MLPYGNISKKHAKLGTLNSERFAKLLLGHYNIVVRAFFKINKFLCSAQDTNTKRYLDYTNTA